MAISERIKYFRCKNRLKQSQLAELIGVSPQAISKWETGTGCPDVSVLVPLAKALRITTDMLLEYDHGLISEEDWDSMAIAYEMFNNAPDSYSYTIEWPCIQQLLPSLRGKSILDFGCGTGIFTYLLEQYYPDEIFGVDSSEGMLKIAEEKGQERHSRAKFIKGDEDSLLCFGESSIDFVFSSTTTHYLPDLKKLFTNIYRILKPEGICILSVIHPVYSAQYPVEHGDLFPEENDWVVRYLDKSRRAYIQPWIEYSDDFENRLSRSFHHTFGDYMNAILSSGFRIQQIREPLPPEQWKVDSFGRYDAFIETPVFMILKISK